VTVFPVDHAEWNEIGLRPRKIRTVETTTKGVFKVAGLPPGEYYILAAPPLPDSWLRRESLERMARSAVRLSLARGEQQVKDLVLKRLAQ
jgi:hypothetical protein